jgi:hypothetical protein
MPYKLKIGDLVRLVGTDLEFLQEQKGYSQGLVVGIEKLPFDKNHRKIYRYKVYWLSKKGFSSIYFLRGDLELISDGGKSKEL